MKYNRIFLLVWPLLLFSCNNDGDDGLEVGQYTKIEVNDVFDAGRVAKGEKIEADFVIKNVGNYPLVIADIRPACSCTVPEYEENPIPPGESTIVKAFVDTDRTGSGKLNKPITVTANTKPSTTTLTIKADVTN